MRGKAAHPLQRPRKREAGPANWDTTGNCQRLRIVGEREVVGARALKRIRRITEFAQGAEMIKDGAEAFPFSIVRRRDLPANV
jgi:hypothetical protein